MAQRDYAHRGNKNKKKKVNKPWLLLLIFLLIGGFAVGLYFLKKNSPETKELAVNVPEKTQPKSVLPSRPEEVWSYIQALETRTVPVDNSKPLDKNMRLTEEQKNILLQMEKEQKEAEQARLREAEARKNEELAAQQRVKVEPVKVEPVKTETPKKDTALSKPAEVKVAKPVTDNASDGEKEVKKQADNPKPEVKKDTNPTATNNKKFGLQCGAFKNKPQAEALQARLSMAGLNARVNESQEWNRVVVGPIGDRAMAAKAQTQAQSITSCVIIGM